MRRLFALPAEIVERRYHAATKELMPDAVDGNSRRKGISGIDQPLRQIEPIRLRPAIAHRRQKGGCRGGYLIARAQKIATEVNVCFTRLRKLSHGLRFCLWRKLRRLGLVIFQSF